MRGCWCPCSRNQGGEDMGTNSEGQVSSQSTSASPSDPLQDASGSADNPFKAKNPLEGASAQGAEVETEETVGSEDPASSPSADDPEPAETQEQEASSQAEVETEETVGSEDPASSPSAVDPEPAAPSIGLDLEPVDQGATLDDGIPRGSSVFPAAGEPTGSRDPFAHNPLDVEAAASGGADPAPLVQQQSVQQEAQQVDESVSQTDPSPAASQQGVADRIKQEAAQNSRSGIVATLFGNKKRVAVTLGSLLVVLSVIWAGLNATGVNFLGFGLFDDGENVQEQPPATVDNQTVQPVDPARGDFCDSADTPSIADVAVLRWGDSLIYDEINTFWVADSGKVDAATIVNNAVSELYVKDGDGCTAEGVASWRYILPRSIDASRVDMDDMDARNRIAVYKDDDDTRVAVAQEVARQLNSCVEAQFVYMTPETTPHIYAMAYQRDHSDVVFVQMTLPKLDELPDGGQGLIAVRCSLGKSEGTDGDSVNQVLISPTLRTLIFTEPPVEQGRLLVQEAEDETNDEGEDGTGDNPTTSSDQQDSATGEQDAATGEEPSANEPSDQNQTAGNEEAATTTEEATSTDDTASAADQNQTTGNEEATTTTTEEATSTDDTASAADQNQTTGNEEATTTTTEEATSTDDTASAADQNQTTGNEEATTTTEEATSTETNEGTTTDPSKAPAQGQPSGDGDDDGHSDCTGDGNDGDDGTCTQNCPGDGDGNDGDDGTCTQNCPGDGDGNDGDDGTCTQNCPGDGDGNDGDDGTCTQNCPGDGDGNDGDDGTCTQNCPGDGDGNDGDDGTCTQDCPGDGDDPPKDDCPAGQLRDNYGNCKAPEPGGPLP